MFPIKIEKCDLQEAKKNAESVGRSTAWACSGQNWESTNTGRMSEEISIVS